MIAGDVFGGAADYYDLLYAEKDYAGEAAFVAKQIRSHAPEAKTVLDLGCGTGRHAVALASLGFEVLGVDRSQSMIDRAQQAPGVAYEVGDVGGHDAGRTFDGVVSLFHVASYQVTDDALGAMFHTMRRHVGNGGIALFDFWYGPAVLVDLPEEREKRVESGDVVLTRRARPVHAPEAHRVDVHYTFGVEDKATGATREFEETHAMRYLFEDELTAFLEAAGLRMLRSGDWMSDDSPQQGSWNAWMSAVPA